MQEPMYIIQKPMSAKGKCVHCNMVFPDDELRLGFRETPAAIEKGPWKWSHVTCVPVDRWDTAEDVYGEVDEIPGVATTEGASRTVRLAHSNARANAMRRANATAQHEAEKVAEKEREDSRKAAEKAKAKAEKAAAKEAEKIVKAEAKAAEKVAKVAALEAKVKLAQTAVNTAAKDLVKALDFDSPQKTADASRIKNKCVVLVGTLHGMSRADAKTAITAAGGHWRDTITCKTELIVLGLSKPSALEKADETAEQKQIDTITGNELLEEFRLAGVSDVKAPAKPAKKKREDGEVQGVTRGGKTRRTSLPAA